MEEQVALKIVLNAHSTAVMGRLGKVVGNTMTNVSPSNLKLIGRATHLICTHVKKACTYEEANAILFEVMEFTKEKSQTAEVALSIIKILESQGLESFLREVIK